MSKKQEKSLQDDIKFLALGCRLNTVEAEKIRNMLAVALSEADPVPGSGCAGPGMTPRAVIVNTCGVTAEAERQSKQAIRRIIRENPDAQIFVTGCAATRAPDDFAAIAGVTRVIVNKDKMNANAYIRPPTGAQESAADSPSRGELSPSSIINENPVNNITIKKFSSLSKGFVQIQNGCSHACTYCITRILRGHNISFPYEQIRTQVRALAANGYAEIVLTGVDIAGYRWAKPSDTKQSEELRVKSSDTSETILTLNSQLLTLSDLCRALLSDVPGMRRLRLSSLDPGIDLKPLIEIMRGDPRMLPHMHLSMQSGSDTILARMGRRHNAQKVRELAKLAVSSYQLASNNNKTASCYLLPAISFSWDLICGFPGETQELFEETLGLIRELKPIRLHAFPFSPRPGTAAATMPDQVPREESKRRVGMAVKLARANMLDFMQSRVGATAQVLMEENNLGRDAHDIPVRITATHVPERTIVNVMLTGISDEPEPVFLGKVIV